MQWLLNLISNWFLDWPEEPVEDYLDHVHNAERVYVDKEDG